MPSERAHGPVVLDAAGAGWLRGGRPWIPDGPLYGVIGDPIDHSLSPAMHAAALRARGLPGVYAPFLVRAGEAGRFLDRAAGLGLRGCNVTAPLKGEVVACCAALSPVARRAEAVNTLTLTPAGWEGHNTDVGGVGAVLRESLAGATPRSALVVGTGGAARAAVLALAGSGVARQVVAGRGVEGRRRVAAWLERCGLAATVAVEDAARATTAFATAVGGPALAVICISGGDPGTAPLPAVDGVALALDLRYGSSLPPGRLPAGWRRVDGLGVLSAQAGLSFVRWFGGDDPASLMAAAVDSSSS